MAIRNFWLAGLFVLLMAGTAQARDVSDVELTDIDGKVHAISDYEGKWVIVNFWATWCPPCLEEIPELVMFHDEHADQNAVVWGVNLERADEQKLRGFIDQQFVSYPVFPLDPKKGNPFGNVPALPTTFVINPEGQLVQRKIGLVDTTWLESAIGN